MYWEIVIPTLLWPIITIIIARKNPINNDVIGMMLLFAFFIMPVYVYIMVLFIKEFNLF